MKNLSRMFVYIIISMILSGFNIVYAEQCSITCSTQAHGTDVTISGQIQNATEENQVTLMVGEPDNIIYINQTQSLKTGEFEFNFKLSQTIPEEGYAFKIGSDSGAETYTGVLKETKEMVAVQNKFIDVKADVDIDGYEPSICAEIYCVEDTITTLKITNKTDNTIIGEERLSSDDNGSSYLYYTLPSLLSRKEYEVLVVCMDGENNVLAEMSVNIDSQILAVTVTGTVRTADNVMVDAQLKSVNTGLIDKNTSFTGSKAVDVTIPNIVSNASFDLIAEGYETEYVENIPEHENISMESAMKILPNTNLNLSIGSSGNAGWYKVIPKFSGMYSINISDGYSIELYECINGHIESIQISEQNCMSYPGEYYVKIASDSGMGGKFVLNISCVSKLVDAVFETTILNDKYYSNMRDGGKLYKNGEKIEFTNTLTPSLWLCNFNGEVYFSNNKTIYKLLDSSYATMREDIKAMFLTADESNIYFSNWSDGGKLYKGTLSEDGNDMEFTKICDDSVTWITIEGDYLYYKNILDGNKTYRILKTSQNLNTGQAVE